MSELQADLETWIHNWVSVYNEKLQAVPCPFAKQAYVDKKIHIHQVDPIGGYSIAELIYYNLDQATQSWPVDKEVIVLGCSPDMITAAELADTVADCNHELLEARGYVALEDHPDMPEVVAGETMNQGSWALVLLQSKEKLNKASAILARQGYYKMWSQENLDDVVNWRKNS
jgi:hypothetical protein